MSKPSGEASAASAARPVPCGASETPSREVDRAPYVPRLRAAADTVSDAALGEAGCAAPQRSELTDHAGNHRVYARSCPPDAGHRFTLPDDCHRVAALASLRDATAEREDRRDDSGDCQDRLARIRLTLPGRLRRRAQPRQRDHGPAGRLVAATRAALEDLQGWTSDRGRGLHPRVRGRRAGAGGLARPAEDLGS